MVVSRFEVFMARLDPTVGREMRKTRPAVVISPDEMNHHLGTVVVAPMTKGGRTSPWRIPVVFDTKDGWVALDHIRSVDKSRLFRKLGTLDASASSSIRATLVAMFGY